MRAVSDRYLYALSGSTLTTVRARPCNPTVRDANGYPAPSTTASLPLLGGSIVQDGSADERLRTEGLTVAAYWPDVGNDRPNAAGVFGQGAIGSSPAATSRPGQPVWPIDYRAPLSPYGKLLLLEVGAEFGNGDVEYARIGYVRVETMDQDDEPHGPIAIETRDLMSFLKDSEMVYDVKITAGTTVQRVFEVLVIEDPWGGMPLGFTNSDLDLDPEFAALTIGVTRSTQGDRFGFLRDLVTAHGRIWYWDGRGKLVVKKPPDPSVPVLDIGGPNDKATPLTKSGRSITRVGVANIVVASQSAVSSGPGVRAVQYDAGISSSPTNIFEFGAVTDKPTSPLIVNDSSATSYAATRLANKRNVPDQRRAEHTVNGAVEPWDVVRHWPRGSSDPGGYTVRQVELTRTPVVPGGAQSTTFRDVRTG